MLPPPAERKSTLYIRLCGSLKIALRDIVHRYFDAERRGAIPPFSDGTTQILFSRPVRIAIHDDWESHSEKIDQATGTERAYVADLFDRYYPAIIVTGITGNLLTSSLNSVYAPALPTIQDPDVQNVYHLLAAGLPGSYQGTAPPRSVGPNALLRDDEIVIGGYADLTASLTCVARTGTEADTLAELLCTFLAHPIFKFILERLHGVAVIREPTLGVQSRADDADSNEGVYGVDVSVGLRGMWEDRPMSVSKVLAVLAGVDLVDP